MGTNFLQQHLKEISDELSSGRHASPGLKKATWASIPKKAHGCSLWKEAKWKVSNICLNVITPAQLLLYTKHILLTRKNPQKLQGSSSSSIKPYITFCTSVYIFVFFLLANVLSCLFKLLRRCCGMCDFFWFFIMPYSEYSTNASYPF